jgi:hypothetical protein
MSKLAQYADYLAEYEAEFAFFGWRKVSLSMFEPICDDCGVPLPDWNEDPEMHVQCDNCNSNNEG